MKGITALFGVGMPQTTATIVAPLETAGIILTIATGIGWFFLESRKAQFRTDAERRFVDDLIIYLDYKIREAERIRNERKQLSFW